MTSGGPRVHGTRDQVELARRRLARSVGHHHCQCRATPIPFNQYCLDAETHIRTSRPVFSICTFLVAAEKDPHFYPRIAINC